MKDLKLEIEELEERIAPGIPCFVTVPVSVPPVINAPIDAPPFGLPGNAGLGLKP